MSIADSLKEWKAARNSLIGIVAAREALGVRGYRSIHLKTKNPYLSPGLWATIQAILNELAFQAECCGAIYIATDGYIFKDDLQAQHFEETLYDMSLQYRKSSGYVNIKNWGAYKVKGKETESYKRFSGHPARAFRAIRVHDIRFPNHISRWWAKSIPHYSKQQWQIGGSEKWAMV